MSSNACGKMYSRSVDRCTDISADLCIQMTTGGCTRIPADRCTTMPANRDIHACMQTYSKVNRLMNPKVFGQLYPKVLMQLISNVCRQMHNKVSRQMHSNLHWRLQKNAFKSQVRVVHKCWHRMSADSGNCIFFYRAPGLCLKMAASLSFWLGTMVPWFHHYFHVCGQVPIGPN